jgi:hypothetical protein
MLFMQQITTFDASANMAPWYIKPVISGFVGQIKVGRRKLVGNPVRLNGLNLGGIFWGTRRE